MKKILVIEDNPDIRENILELLEAEEFDCLGAEDGTEGIRLAQENRPDLIMCDVMMPEVSGLDVLKTLQQDPNTATIPFIFLTALADKTDMRQGMELGADDYLTKPYTREEVLKAIACRFTKQEILKQRYNAVNA